MSEEINFLALIKGQDRYLFFYDSESNEKLLEIFDKYAFDKKLSFSRRDTDYLIKKV